MGARQGIGGEAVKRTEEVELTPAHALKPPPELPARREEAFGDMPGVECDAKRARYNRREYRGCGGVISLSHER